MKMTTASLFSRYAAVFAHFFLFRLPFTHAGVYDSRDVSRLYISRPAFPPARRQAHFGRLENLVYFNLIVCLDK